VRLGRLALLIVFMMGVGSVCLFSPSTVGRFRIWSAGYRGPEAESIERYYRAPFPRFMVRLCGALR
jgi:hypothetical protein